MPKKQYSPALVVDPSSPNHLVRLHPNQDFNLRLSPFMRDAKVFLTSEFLSLVKDSKSIDGSTLFQFKQNADFTEWSKISSAYLGEVTILNKNCISSVCILLESDKSHHPNMVTIINPIGSQIKIEPHQVLEVVVYEPNCEKRDLWTCHIKPGPPPLELTYEQVGHEIVYPGVNYQSFIEPDDLEDVCLVMPRACDIEKPMVEHHYYFRCKYESLSAVTKKGNGVFEAGKICFSPLESKSHTSYHNSVDVHLNLRERSRKDAFKVLFFPKRFHVISSPTSISSYKGETIYPNSGGYPLNSGRKKAVPKTSPTTALTTTNNYGSSYRSQSTVRYNYTRSIYVPKVSLKPKAASKLDSGCKIAWCVKTGQSKKNKNKNKSRRRGKKRK